jgi:hypothetical protein
MGFLFIFTPFMFRIQLPKIKVANLKRVGICFLCLTLAQSCLLKNKVERTVNSYYTKRSFNLQTYYTDKIVLNTKEIPTISGFCKTNYKSFFTVPLLFYTFSKEIIKCDVNPRILINTISNEINSMAENEDYAEMFSDKEIELIFKKVPTSFYHRYRSHFVVPLFSSFFFIPSYWGKTELCNVGDSIVVNYSIRNKVSITTIKQGEIHYLLKGKQIERNGEEKIKFIEDFYRYYDDQLLTSGNEIAKMIVNEIK